MARRNSTPPSGVPSFLSISDPPVLRGNLVHVVDLVACADIRRAEALELQLKTKHEPQDASLRRCDECALNLCRDVLRALGACPRWGKPRHGFESRCPAFVAKDGAR